MRFQRAIRAEAPGQLHRSLPIKLAPKQWRLPAGLLSRIHLGEDVGAGFGNGLVSTGGITMAELMNEATQ